MKKKIVLTLLLFKTLVINGQTIETFEYSYCLGEAKVCDYTKAEIINEVKNQDYYEVRFAAFNNCMGDFESKLFTRDDSTINIVICVKGCFTEDDIEIALCDCLFEFTFRIRDLKGMTVQRLLINGESFDDHNRRYIKPIIEPVEEIQYTRPDHFYLLDTAFVFTDKPAEFLLELDSINLTVNKSVRNIVSASNIHEGIVYVKTIIGRDGLVEEVLITKGLNEKIDQATKQAILDMNLRFKPAEIQGHAVKTQLVLPIKIRTRPNN